MASPARKPRQNNREAISKNHSGRGKSFIQGGGFEFVPDSDLDEDPHSPQRVSRFCDINDLSYTPDSDAEVIGDLDSSIAASKDRQVGPHHPRLEARESSKSASKRQTKALGGTVKPNTTKSAPLPALRNSRLRHDTSNGSPTSAEKGKQETTIGAEGETRRRAVLSDEAFRSPSVCDTEADVILKSGKLTAEQTVGKIRYQPLRVCASATCMRELLMIWYFQVEVCGVMLNHRISAASACEDGTDSVMQTT